MKLIDRDLAARLTTIVGADNIRTEKADCWAYGYDNSRQHALPQAVVYAANHSQVRDIVRLCNQYNVVLTARGRGTGTAGASVPVRGGIVLSLERMNRIVSVDADNRVMVVEPGVTNGDVQRAARRVGFFWPPDPTSADVCTVGGNLACNAAGPRAVKYGTTRDNVLGLRAVTGDGAEIRTGVYTTKGVVGYDLTRLLIGSEGTLAIVTEAYLKLSPLPETIRTMRAVYRDISSAAMAISKIMAQPITPCVLEFIDGKAIEMIRTHSRADLPQDAGALLMIEIDGPAVGLDNAMQQVEAAARNPGLVSIATASTEQEVEDLWATRKALSPALRTIAPKKINEDVVVPVSRIPDLIGGLDTLSKRHDIMIVNFGHAGNGNIHVNLLVDPDAPGQLARARTCLDEVFDLVLALNGTLSGEHGIGMVKCEYVGREIDPTTLGLMRRIKTQFDPNGILNPGKLFPHTAP